jgi:hypothetical protein
MHSLLTLIGWLIFGALTSYLAKERGRSPTKWFVVGVLLGIFGLILVFIFPKVAKKQEVVPAKEPEPVITDQKFWYYLDPENKQFGPMSFNALENALREGKICLETYVWNEDLTDWKSMKDFTSSTSQPLG